MCIRDSSFSLPSSVSVCLSLSLSLSLTHTHTHTPHPHPHTHPVNLSVDQNWKPPTWSTHNTNGQIWVKKPTRRTFHRPRWKRKNMAANFDVWQTTCTTSSDRRFYSLAKHLHFEQIFPPLRVSPLGSFCFNLIVRDELFPRKTRVVAVLLLP